MASGRPAWAQGAGSRGASGYRGYSMRPASEVVEVGWTVSGGHRGHGMRRAHAAITDGGAATEQPSRAWHAALGMTEGGGAEGQLRLRRVYQRTEKGCRLSFT